MGTSSRLILITAASLFSLCSAALAQSVPTEFPAGATPVAAEQLRELVQDKVFTMQSASGQQIRIEYKGGYGYINIGSQSDSGPWRVEGSTVCNEWRRFPGGCTETRLLGSDLYVRRLSNNEVMLMKPQR